MGDIAITLLSNRKRMNRVLQRSGRHRRGACRRLWNLLTLKLTRAIYTKTERLLGPRLLRLLHLGTTGMMKQLASIAGSASQVNAAGCSVSLAMCATSKVV